MPLIPGLAAMPIFIANSLLSLVPDRSLPVRGPDRVGAVSPMFNEEAGAGQALASLLSQSEPFDELAVSVNGGSDDTLKVVRATLREHGYARVYEAPAADFDGSLERWHAAGGPGVVVLDHAAPISKADSINRVVLGGYLSCERVLVVDGDTIFDQAFVERLKENFYRLRQERHAGGWRYVIEDIGIQSGAVTSLPPGPGRPLGDWISRSRAGEYAVATTLRRGQTTRLGGGRLLGSSRLFTVVGCGFTVRSSSFPMPADTITEDHDFTLQVQNEERLEESVTIEEMQARGFRVVQGGREVEPARFFVPEDEVVLRTSGEARFVTGALMHTEDPLNLGGYLRQMERWNGGGIENFVKRLRAPKRRGLKPNVAFAAGAAQAENLLNLIFLLLVLPVALGVSLALPGYGSWLRLAAIWLGLDLLLTLLIVGLGFGRIWRAQGERGWRLASRTWSSSLRSALPFMTLRLLNTLAYIVALTRYLPRALRTREEDARVTITWERPRASVSGPAVTRSATVALSLGLTCALLVGGAFYVAETSRPGYRETWRLMHAVEPIRAEEHVALPLHSVIDLIESWEPIEAALPWRGSGLPPLLAVAHGGGEHGGLSEYCSVGFTAQAAPERRVFGGDAGAYSPLTYWEKLVLGRLVPLAALMEEAATAYDVPLKLLLLVLINESFLDPLAVGPTEDYGLSQVTGDALTLLSAISEAPDSRFANPRLLSGQFSVFDPDFSICAGAAKLAWARAQPGGDDDRYAYARYINPLEGVQRGGLNPVHEVLVGSLAELEPLADALLNAFSVYRVGAESLAPQDLTLFEVYERAAAGELSVREAYGLVHELMTEFGIDDGQFYSDVKEGLYGQGVSTASLPRAP